MANVICIPMSVVSYLAFKKRLSKGRLKIAGVGTNTLNRKMLLQCTKVVDTWSGGAARGGREVCLQPGVGQVINFLMALSSCH